VSTSRRRTGAKRTEMLTQYLTRVGSVLDATLMLRRGRGEESGSYLTTMQE
jgi:hypothetical protein